MLERTLEYLSDPLLRGLYWPGVVVGLAIAVLASPLSALVVLRRLAFIGQGVSHAAFGGIGLALALGAFGVGFAGVEPGRTAIVLVFCILAALAIAWLGDRGRAARPDSAIGIVLVASMAIGFLLHRSAAARAAEVGAAAPPGLEDVLFGSVLGVGWADAWVAWSAAVGVLVTLVSIRRGLVFWAFEPEAAEAFGVPTARTKRVVMVLLALAVVVAMKLAGVVLATALLVLPGATALRLSDRLWPVVWLSLSSGLLGVALGLVLSFEWDRQPGPMIVLTLVVLYAGGFVVSAVRERTAGGGVTA